MALKRGVNGGDHSRKGKQRAAASRCINACTHMRKAERVRGAGGGEERCRQDGGRAVGMARAGEGGDDEWSPPIGERED